MNSRSNIKIYKNVTKGLSFLLLLLFARYNAQQRTLTVAGTNWTATIPSITEAGSNYSGTYESVANQFLLGVSVPLLLSSGKVSVHYEPNPTWNNSLSLAVKRTGNGTTVCLLCTLSGGTTYLILSQTAIELFRINAVLALASYSNIPIQVQLSGVSVTIPAANYQSRIVFTISAL